MRFRNSPRSCSATGRVRLRFQRVTSPYQKVAAVNQKIETPDKQNAMMAAGTRIQMNDEHPDAPAMTLANYLLGGSPGARLFSRIRSKEGLSYGTSSMFNAPTKDDGAMFFAMAISAPQNSPKVEASFKDELEQIRAKGFTAEEVAAGKKAWLDQQKIQYAQDQAVTRVLAGNEFHGRTMKWTEDMQNKVAALTTEQVNAAFRSTSIRRGCRSTKLAISRKQACSRSKSVGPPSVRFMDHSRIPPSN
jgi:zinc protease